MFRRSRTIARRLVAVDLIDQSNQDIFGQSIVGRDSRKLYQVADDESDLNLILRLSVLQPVVVPDIDSPIRARLKTQMPT